MEQGFGELLREPAVNRGRVKQGYSARFQATQSSYTWEACLPPATPIYHATACQPPTVTRAESLCYLAPWKEECARKMALQPVSADPWK